MDIIELQPYKRLSNQELIEETFEYMSTVNDYWNDDKNHYRNEILILDNLVKEGKRRKIALDSWSLAKKIFTE